MNESEKRDFLQVSVEMGDSEASFSLKALSGYLSRYYKKRVLILLDEYDTPMQEALRQIEEKDYQACLVAKGISEERIRKYGFAFCGKRVLIGNMWEN